MLSRKVVAMRLVLRSALAAVLLAGCAEGVDPPEPTKTVKIQGGTFEMGGGEMDPCRRTRFNQVGELVVDCAPATQSEIPPNPVQVRDFCIDEHEVTVLQYRHCVARGDCSRPKATNAGNGQSEGGTIEGYFNKDRYDDFPVLGVTWEQAQAYCAYRGGRLPLEAEWEFAARSRGERPAPFDPTLLNDCQRNKDRIAMGECADFKVRATRSSPEDKTAQGVYDLGANAQEWVADEFDFMTYCDEDQFGPALRDLFDFRGSGKGIPQPVGGRLPGALFRAGDDACLTAGADFAGGCNPRLQTCMTACGTAWRQSSTARDVWPAEYCLRRLQGTDVDPDCATPPATAGACRAQGTRDSCPTYCDCIDANPAHDDGSACLAACFEDYRVCAVDGVQAEPWDPRTSEPCVKDDVALACWNPEPTTQRGARPRPLCKARNVAGEPVTQPHRNQAPEEHALRGAHVVRGANFQDARACEARVTRREGRGGTLEQPFSPVVGFRCAYEANSARCK